MKHRLKKKKERKKLIEKIRKETKNCENQGDTGW